MDWVGRDMPWGGRETSSARHLATAFPEQWGRKIACHPPVPSAEVARRQASALFNLVPSTWDVFNFTVAEAMASGRPTIVSTGAGAGELIVEGENGFLFPAGEGAALAAAIDRLASFSPTRRAQIGRAARDTVGRELDPSTIANARLAAYRLAIERFNGPSSARRRLAGRTVPPGRSSDREVRRLPVRIPHAHNRRPSGDPTGRSVQS